MVVHVKTGVCMSGRWWRRFSHGGGASRRGDVLRAVHWQVRGADWQMDAALRCVRQGVNVVRVYTWPPRERAAITPVADGRELGRVFDPPSQAGAGVARRRMRPWHDYGGFRQAPESGAGLRHRPFGRRDPHGTARSSRRRFRNGRCIHSRVRRRVVGHCARASAAATPVRSSRCAEGNAPRRAAWRDRRGARFGLCVIHVVPQRRSAGAVARAVSRDRTGQWRRAGRRPPLALLGTAGGLQSRRGISLGLVLRDA
jgi:hypothetical protein